jgi:Flp pilus assembly pilin Flp
MNTLQRLWKDEEAANAVEYGLITAVIAIALLTTLYYFRNAIRSMFTSSADQINTRQ